MLYWQRHCAVSLTEELLLHSYQSDMFSLGCFYEMVCVTPVEPKRTAAVLTLNYILT
uniref:Uncharacterized protein n=1 Tax=Anguilla anguilla TaxID=7936 RepID=A0A0E9T4V4_ANGAN